jgi:Fe-S-cluster containining protein
MNCGSCTGACCALFCWPAEWNPDRSRDGAYIKDMLIPLTAEQAVERMERFEIEPYWADFKVSWDGVLQSSDRQLMTCRHWDGESRLCGAYDERPSMCKGYPYYTTEGARDCDYRCGYKLSFEQMWEYHYTLYGELPPNIILGGQDA